MKRMLVFAIAASVAAFGFASGCTKDDSVLLGDSGVASVPDSAAEDPLAEEETTVPEEVAPSFFVPVTLSSTVNTVTPTSTEKTTLVMNLGGDNESAITPEVSWGKSSHAGYDSSTSVDLKASEQMALDLSKDKAELVLKATLSQKICIPICYSNTTTLEDVKLTFEFERDPENLSATKVNLTYSGPNFLNNKPLEHTEYHPILAYDLPESGDHTLKISPAADPSNVMVDRRDQMDGVSLSKRSITLAGTYEYTLAVQRDAESNLISSGDMKLASLPVTMSYTSNVTDTSGNELLEINGAGSATVGSNTSSIATDGVFMKIDSSALAQERAVVMDAIILSALQFTPLWAIVP